jgi:uncharacterized protein
MCRRLRSTLSVREKLLQTRGNVVALSKDAQTAVHSDSTVVEGFLPAVSEHLDQYVYLLIDPRDDRIFCVGTGAGDACFRHLWEARANTVDSSGGFSQLATIRAIEADERRVRIDVLRHDLDPRTAATVAVAVSEALGLSDGGDAGQDLPGVGRMSVGDVNTRYGAEPITIAPEHAVMLVQNARAFRRGIDDRQLYEISRGWWKSRVPQRPAQWAFAVFDGVVRAVYRIDAWEPARAGNHWGFRGQRDPVLERRYVLRDVSAYLTDDNPDPVVYVNC